jgi:hypothetical protein
VDRELRYACADSRIQEEMMKRTWCQSVLLVVAGSVFLIAGLVAAQVRTTGQLAGTVVDPSGAVLAAAKVTARDTTTGVAQSVTANASGQYVFPNLLPGNYQVTATAPGFATAVYNDVVVEAARTKDLEIRMKVGAATELVEVSALGVALETTSNTLATTMEPDTVQDLPLAGRDILALAASVPGAQSGGDERFTTYNSLPNAAINITVDGINVNSQRYRTSTTGFFTFAPLRLGAFDELTVSTSDLTADAGAEGSTQVRFVTKRGTNQFHGNAFWQAINSFFNANSYTRNALRMKRPVTVLNDWGGSLGGPLWKNKLFFFFNFEGENRKFAGLVSTMIPTLDTQGGLFTYLGTDNVQYTTNLFQLAQSSGFPATVNPMIGNMLSAINGYAQKGTLSAVTGMPYEQNLNFTQKGTIKQRYPTGRLDWQITPKVAWHGSMDLWWRDISNVEVSYPGDPYESNGFKSTYYVASSAVDWTITPHLINQANFGIQSNTELWNEGNKPDVFQSQGNFYINTASLTSGPVFAPLIPSWFISVPRNNPLWNVYDNLTWTRGKHTFTFGGDLRISNSHELEINNPPAENLGLSSADDVLTTMFSPSNVASYLPNINTAVGDLSNAEAVYATLVGRINYVFGSSWVDTTTHQYQILGKAVQWEKQTVGGMYFQDSWRTTPHFTLNYGFRWQLSGAIHNTNNLWTSPTLADLYGPSTRLFHPGELNGNLNPQIYLRPDPYSGDFKQPAPNFGFAWNPTFDHGFLHKLSGGNNLVIRGGVALSRYDEGWVPLENVTLWGNPGGTQWEWLYPGSGGLPGAVLGDSLTLSTFPTSFTFPQPQSEFFPGASFSTMDPKIRSPYVETWNFGIQRSLPGKTVLEINYVGNHAVHMWQGYDLNETNIFENGFLQEFQHAQQNLAVCQNTPSCAANLSFADQNLAGQVPLPIFDAAFGGPGAAPGATDLTGSFTNSTFITMLQQSQAGALANQLGTQAGGVFLCNMVGTALSPCLNLGLSSGPGNYPINFFQLNPFAAGGVLTVLSDPGSSSYNGLQVQVKHQTTHGLTMGANYAFSHSFTNRYLGDYYTADSAVVNFVTLHNPRLSRGPSPYDLRHVFNTALTYDLPFGTGKSWKTGNPVLDRIVGGWTVGTIVTAQTGRNFKLQGGYNSYNYSNAWWPNASDSGVVLNGITVSQLQSKIGLYPGPNPSEPVVLLPPDLLASDGSANRNFISPVTTPGELGRFVYLKGPRFVNTDISIVKSIPIKERVKFNIYAEFLNAFNHPNWAVIDSFSGGVNNPAQYANVTSTTFPRLSLANDPRNIQFRMQLVF